MKYVLDACAMIAVLSNENGAEKIVEVYKNALSGTASIEMNAVNFLEVYYTLCRDYGENRARIFFDEMKKSIIKINNEITDELFLNRRSSKRNIKFLWRIYLPSLKHLFQTPY